MVLVILAVNLLQQPGLVTFDTKLDLQFDSIAFMERSLTLWNPQAALGELQNQATGYLFPLGPVFALGALVPVPMWVWERLWTALVMLIAYDGARRLSSVWTGVGTLGSVTAGLAFALAPRVITTVGGLSGETLPTAVLPWTVLPLACYVQGRMRRWTALVLSAATVPFMGGQNATEVIATLLLPLLVLVLAEQAWSRRVADATAWTAMTVVASLWWLLPLIMLGRYSPPFLDFIESSRNTTSSIGWLAAFRGTDHWVAFLTGGSSSGWEAGWDLVSSPGMVVVTAAVAGAGLVGMLLCTGPAKPVLVVSFVMGLLVLTLGSAGWDASPLRDSWLWLLDGPLAPFRNIHKFDPLVRLPLSMGVGVAATTLWKRAPRTWRGRAAPGAPVAAVGLLLLAVVASATPALRGDLRASDGFEDIPGPWRQAASYLGDQQARVLVLPASGFGIQTWGRTIDTPLQVLGSAPWVMRNQTPLVSPETARLLDSVERLVAEGRPTSRLREVLQRLGVTHVLVRNDLDPFETDAPAPPAVNDVVADAPGLTLDRVFGDRSRGPMLEVYRTDRPSSDPRVRLFPYDDRATVRGGSGSVVPLVEAGLLPPGRLLVPVGRPGGSTTFVTDTERRVERNFGRVHEALSDVMTPMQPFRVQRAQHDYQADPPHLLTVARYDGIADVRASSSTGYADTPGPVRPEEGPWAALDESLLTSWTTSPLTDPEGEWIEVAFRRPTRLAPVTLEFDTARGAVVRAVRVSTDVGEVPASVGPDGAIRGLPLPEGLTRRLRVTVSVAQGSEQRQVRLAHLRLGDRKVRRSLVVPGPVAADTTVLLTGDPGRRACRVRTDGSTDCLETRARVSTEQSGFTRLLHVDEASNRTIEGSVVATNGPQVAALLEPLSRRPVTVRATSFSAGDPVLAPQNAFDGDQGTTWMAAKADKRPVLDLRWRQPRVVDRIRPILLPGIPGRLPSVLRVTSDEGTQTVRVGGDALAVMEPVRTTRLRIALDGSRSSVGELPFALSDLEIAGLDDLTYKARTTATSGAVCGLGPTITVGGQRTRTRVVGTVGAVLSGGTLRFEPCDLGTVLPAGDAVPVTAENPPGFAVTELVLRPADPPVATGDLRTLEPAWGIVPSVQVEEWDATVRSVEVQVGRAAVLAIPQSANPGWSATMEGHPLQEVQADGWMQGWLLPAGSRGTVVLTYDPQPYFVAGLALGLAAAVLLMLVAALMLVSHLRRGDRQARVTLRAASARRSWPWVAPAVAVLTSAGLAVVSWPLALGLVLGVALVRYGRGVLGLGVTTLGVGVVWAAASVDTTVVAPTGVDVIVATAIGLVLGGAWMRGRAVAEAGDG